MNIGTVAFILTLHISIFAWSSVDVPRKDWKNMTNYNHLSKLHKMLTKTNHNRSARTLDISSKYGDSN